MESRHQSSRFIWDKYVTEHPDLLDQATVPSTPRYHGQHQALTPMPSYQRRGQQSLDHGQGWNRLITEPGRKVIPFRGLASSSWAAAPVPAAPPYPSPTPGNLVLRRDVPEAQLVPWNSSGDTTPRAVRDKAGNFSSETPTPAEIQWMNSWTDSSSGIYAYCIDRGGGRVTRMIPADMLPSLVGIPPHEPKSSGMETLQPPRGSPPFGVPSTDQPVTIRGMTRGPKKDKDFCDKWIHEGVCAFVQQGCRYKHEMPMDRAGQIRMGLFQGLPQWYKKQKGLEKPPVGDSQVRRSRRLSEPPERALLDDPNIVSAGLRGVQEEHGPGSPGQQARRNDGTQNDWRLGNPPRSAGFSPPCNFGAIGQPRQHNR